LRALTKNPQLDAEAIVCRNSLGKTSAPLWKKFNYPVETMGNEWGKIQLKIRIAKKSTKVKSQKTLLLFWRLPPESIAAKSKTRSPRFI
jgi:hypothetical protein